MFDHITAHFAGAATLTGFGSPAFDGFCGSCTIGVEAGVGRRTFGRAWCLCRVGR
jgi:hypothetical protein